jgi:Protein of unknown function (DUF3455)
MERKCRLSQFTVAYAGVLALCGLLAAAASARPAAQTAPGDPLDPRTYAADSRLFLVAHASGVQKYTCQANGTWLFTDPEATLYKTTGVPKPIGTHFLNFATGRPVWRLKDGSSVEAARTATVSAGAGNIAWLLLQAVPTTAGSDGNRLASTTWVQRLNTSGGVAPAGKCTPGERIAVAYSADYFFWRAARRGRPRPPTGTTPAWPIGCANPGAGRREGANAS